METEVWKVEDVSGDLSIFILKEFYIKKVKIKIFSERILLRIFILSCCYLEISYTLV